MVSPICTNKVNALSQESGQPRFADCLSAVDTVNRMQDL